MDHDDEMRQIARELAQAARLVSGSLITAARLREERRERELRQQQTRLESPLRAGWAPPAGQRAPFAPNGPYGSIEERHVHEQQLRVQRERDRQLAR